MKTPRLLSSVFCLLTSVFCLLCSASAQQTTVLFDATTNTLARPTAAQFRTANGLAIGTNVQAYSANLASWSAVTRAAAFDAFVATPSSVTLAALLADKTGTGSAVFATSPTLVTPALGVATATSLNKVALTAPLTGATLTIAEGKTLTASNTLTLAGTDASTLNIGAGGTLVASAYTDATNASNLSSGTLSAARLPALVGDVTSVAGTATTALANIPSGVTAAGSLLATNIVAPATPALGKNYFYFDSTSKNVAAKSDSGVVNHGIQSRSATASNWIRSIADDGTTTISQPVFADISGTLPVTAGGTGITTATLGDIYYSSAANTLAALPGNTTTTRKFLRQTGTGLVSAAPAWDTLLDADIPSALTGKTYNALTPTALASGYTLAGGTTSKTLTVAANVNTGTADGTLGSAAFTASSSYFPATGTTGTGAVVLATSPALTTPNIGAATGASLSVTGQLTSTVVTGTAPLVVSSTTNVANLNASSLNGATFASPGPIGATTPAAGNFTTGTFSTSALVTGGGNGFVLQNSALAQGRFATVSSDIGYIGDVDSIVATTNVRGKTTLGFQISGVSVGQFTSTGINNAVIGATTPASGNFTTLTTTGKITASSSIQPVVTTVAGLPSASPAGQIAFVTDATLTTSAGLGLVVTGGGVNFSPVYSDGTSWRQF